MKKTVVILILIFIHTACMTADHTVLGDAAGETSQDTGLAENTTTDPWLNQFIIYSDDGKALLYFPRFHQGSFVIPAGVEEIGEYAFAECSLSRITIPEGVTRLNEGAFYGCSHLKEITFPKSLVEIGPWAFSRSYISQETLQLGESIQKIGRESFSGNNFKSLVVEGKDTVIDRGFISGNSFLEYADLRYVKELRSGAFEACSALKEVLLPWKTDCSPLGIDENAKIFLFSEEDLTTGVTSYDHLLWIDSEGGLNVRDAPGGEGNRIAALADKTPVEMLEVADSMEMIDQKNGQWTRVRSGSVEGWVFGGYLAFEYPGYKPQKDRIFNRHPALKEYDSSDQNLTPEMIEGIWSVEYSEGKPLDVRGEYTYDVENFIPYTGSGTTYAFQLDGSCAFNTYSEGTYTMNGQHVRCSYEREAGFGDIERWVENYEITLLDQTHIQIKEYPSAKWYICARDDESLWESLKVGSIDAFIQHVREQSYTGDTTFSCGKTLLMIAVERHNPEAVQWLIDNTDANLNQRNIYGMTALHYAMDTNLEKDDPELSDHWQVVELLIDAGADVNAIDDFGQTPLDYSLYTADYKGMGFKKNHNSSLRYYLAVCGGKSSSEEWAFYMTDQDFFYY